jgi:hypothetical protein
MPLFSVCNLTVESSEEFPELGPSPRERAELLFQICTEPTLPAGEWRWFHHWELPSGEVWLEIGKRRGEYLLRFPDLADFVISEAGEQVRCLPVSDTPPNTLRHLFLDQVLPLVLSLHGSTVLHASAVDGPHGAIAFAGGSGCGKSTLAAGLCARGFPLLTDDCLVLREEGGGLRAIPSYPGLRLWEDSLAGLRWDGAELEAVSHYSEKKRLVAGNGALAVATDPVPLARLYLLSPPPDQPQSEPLAIAPVRPQEALIELVRRAYCLDITDRRRIQNQFEALGRIAAGAAISALRFPYDYGRLQEVCDAILRDGEGA